MDCAFNSRFPQELFTPAQHLPHPPTTLATAACIALEPGGCCRRTEGGCKVEVGILSPCTLARKQGSALAGEYPQWQKQPFRTPRRSECQCLRPTPFKGTNVRCSSLWPQEPEPQECGGGDGFSWQALGSWFGPRLVLGRGKGGASGANFKSRKYRVSP